MSTKAFNKYLFTCLALFIVLAVVGGMSGVSWQANLIRAAGSAILFVIILWVFTKFLLVEIFKDDNNTKPTVTGQKFDIVLPADDSVIEPMAQQQIDPKLNKVINEDPERVASMVKKMGLEE